MTEATGQLEWSVSGKLFATFGATTYRIDSHSAEAPKKARACVSIAGGWNVLTSGTLQACMDACQEDADKAIQTARGAQ